MIYGIMRVYKKWLQAIITNLQSTYLMISKYEPPKKLYHNDLSQNVSGGRVFLFCIGCSPFDPTVR